MICDNSSNENDQLYKLQKTSASVYFDDIFEKSLEQDWQHKMNKHRQSIFAQKEHNNITAWWIDSLER